MMKALVLREYGPAENLSYEDFPKPMINKPTQVLVQVKAIGVNPGECHVRSGKAKALFGLKFPAIIGCDYSGVVVQVGSKVTEFKVGDEVVGEMTPSSNGSYAEFLVHDLKLGGAMCLKPSNLSFVEAASIPMGALTSYEGLVNLCGLKEKQVSASGSGPRRVLIVGASGGLGSNAVGIAKSLGAYVVGVCSAKNFDMVKNQLGADEVLDYSSKDFKETLLSLPKFDIVFDVIGGDSYYHLTKQALIRRKGIYCTSVIGPKPFGSPEPYTILRLMSYFRTIFWRKMTASNPYKLVMDAPYKSFSRIFSFAEKGTLKLPKITTFHIRDGALAMKEQETNHVSGKIVLVTAIEVEDKTL